MCIGYGTQFGIVLLLFVSWIIYYRIETTDSKQVFMIESFHSSH